jgi:small conductance mechanosensitive channel
MKLEFENISFDMFRVIIPLIYIIIGIVFFQILKRVITKVKPKRQLKISQNQKFNTIKMLLVNIIKYVIILFVILAILSDLGINVKSILAGLGIGTAIIGLAFQDLAKDLIAGVSIITDGEYEVGDIIEVEGFRGEVIFIGLRTTRIRDFKGATKIISNRLMNSIINYSLNNSLAVIDVDIAYENNQDEIDKVINKLIEKLSGKIPNATGELECWGINQLSSSSVVYRIVVETKPNMNFAVERFLRKEIKKEFDANNIKIPYQQIEVHNGK